MTRDQERAIYAYARVDEVGAGDFEQYKIAVNDLGANILRSGLAAAMATLERSDRPAVRQLREHLAGAGVPGLEQTTGASLPGTVRQLGLNPYMLASREMLKVVVWLKRAVQAGDHQ